MRLHTIINIIITALLVILGSILGGSYKNSLHLFWLSVLIILAVIIQFLLNTIQSQNAQIKAEKGKISAFLLRRDGANTSLFQCSIYPKNFGGRIIKDRVVPIELYINSSIGLTNPLEIKLSTNKNCIIKVNGQNINSTRYANLNNFILNNCMSTELENKYFEYSFEVEFKESGEYIFNVEANNGESMREVSNSITVQ